MKAFTLPTQENLARTCRLLSQPGEPRAGAFLPMRTQGSCRFAPYYKAQWFDEKQLAWRDVQKQFATPDEARAAFKKGKWRVMEITMTGRKPL